MLTGFSLVIFVLPVSTAHLWTRYAWLLLLQWRYSAHLQGSNVTEIPNCDAPDLSLKLRMYQNSFSAEAPPCTGPSWGCLRRTHRHHSRLGRDSVDACASGFRRLRFVEYRRCLQRLDCHFFSTSEGLAGYVLVARLQNSACRLRYAMTA